MGVTPLEQLEENLRDRFLNFLITKHLRVFFYTAVLTLGSLIAVQQSIDATTSNDSLVNGKSLQPIHMQNQH